MDSGPESLFKRLNGAPTSVMGILRSILFPQPKQGEQGEPEKLELGMPFMVDPSSSLLAPSTLKGQVPTRSSRWKPRPLITRTRLNKKLTWEQYIIIASIMFLPIAIISIILYFTLQVHAVKTIEVDLGYTQYAGSTLDNGIDQWLGMRYAEPPLGNLRFKKPQPPPKASKQDAKKHGALCNSTPSSKLRPTESEDCLFIDVSAPTKRDTPLPVYFFIQGGGFNSLANPNLDGAKLIKASGDNIVVVTFNYRVGPWGFLASQEVEDKGDLNVGLLDQRAALEWVQKYIHLFGGDPKRVTIDGDSAGAASVNLHLLAYGGRDDKLFHGAIGQSNSFGAQLTVKESQYQYDGLVERTGCKAKNDTLQCLRDLDVKDIVENNINMPTPGGAGKKPVFMYSNVVEGKGGFTEDYTYPSLEAGKFVKVPVIFGGVTNEGTIFTPPGIKTREDMNKFLKSNWVKLTDEQLDQIHKQYKEKEKDDEKNEKKDARDIPKNKGAYWSMAAAAYGEMRYNCPGLYLSEVYYKANGGNDSWHYHWDVMTDKNMKSGIGVAHTAEVSSIWGSSTGAGSRLIPAIQAYWTSFIRTGNPNTHRALGSAVWGVFNETMPRLHFPNDPHHIKNVITDKLQKERCHYYQEIGKEIGM